MRERFARCTACGLIAHAVMFDNETRFRENCYSQTCHGALKWFEPISEFERRVLEAVSRKEVKSIWRRFIKAKP